MDYLTLKKHIADLSEKINDKPIVIRAYDRYNRSIFLRLKTINKTEDLCICLDSPNQGLWLSKQCNEFDKNSLIVRSLNRLIINSRLVDISLAGNESEGQFDRVVKLHFISIDEYFGHRNDYYIICEFTGRISDVFLCNSEFKILDRISRTSNNLVGDSYRLPDSYKLLNPNNIEDKDLFDVFSAPKNEWINKIGYLSPFMTKEIVFRTAIIGDSIENRIKIFKEIIKENFNLNIFLYKVNGKIQTISSYKLNHIIGSDTEKIEELNFKTVNEAMNYVEENLTPKRLEQEKTRVISLLNKSLKLKKQLLKEQLELKKQYEDSDKYQNIGNLITANLYRLKSGDKLLEAEDWVTNKIVKIELDPSKTPSANAKKYFNLYKKSKRGIIEVDKRISSLNSDIKWFEEQIWLAENAEIETWLQIDENTKTNRFNKNKENSKKNQSSKNVKIQIKAYLEENNCKYYVGHNAKQNDQITFKLGKKGDIWFHANDVPGAHILLKKIEGDITKENILIGARLAALNSFAKNSSKVAVDYTDVSNVKRIPNGGLGQVSYTNQHTILVNLTPIDTSNKT